MENWKKVLVEGFFPLISIRTLVLLKEALTDKSKEIVQFYNFLGEDDKICSACVIGFMVWKEKNLSTIDEAKKEFANICKQVDNNFLPVTFSNPHSTDLMIFFDSNLEKDKIYSQIIGEINEELTRRNYQAS